MYSKTNNLSYYFNQNIGMEIKPAVGSIFDQLRYVLERITDEAYKAPSVALSGSSMGQHIRHSLEFFGCLCNSQESGTVNYDNRKRDVLIEENRLFALACISDLLPKIEALNDQNELVLELSYGESSVDPIRVTSNFNRELVYNIEHAIHHMALIKIGLRELAPDLVIPKGFGVANSTLRYNQEQQIV
jgi:hypothetical protein